MSEALDCPFCGSPAEEFGHDNHGLMYTSHGCSNKECPARRLRCPLGFWNTRHVAPVVISEEMTLAQVDHLQRIHSAAFDFITYGRPKEGSDKYKAAWDTMRSTMMPGPYPGIAEELSKASAKEAASLPLPLPPKDKQ